MRITDVRTVLLTGPSTNDPFMVARRRRSAAFVEVHTDAGHTGLGETYAGYFCPELVPRVVEFFKPVLIGQSPLDTATLWARMYHAGNYWCRVGLGLAVLNGIDAALWDLKGKALGVPVHELLGGRKHDALLAYATGAVSNHPHERLAAKVDHYLGLGFRAFKVGTGGFTDDGQRLHFRDPGPAAEFEAAKLAFLRRHAGPDVRIMLDGHQNNNLADPGWELPTALAVARALEPYDLFFLEEPLPYTDPWSYAELRRSTTVPIAGGECLTGLYEWRVFADAFDIAQPDASFTGGLAETMKVAALFESRGRRVATHAWGAGPSLMQNVHCAFAAANTAICEVPPDFGPLHADIVGDAFVMRDGLILPPQPPGLGVALSDAVRRRYPFEPGSGESNPVPGKPLPP